MSVVPKKVVDRIQFYEDHIAPWTTNATAIGTTTTAVTNLETLTQAARDAYDAQQAAQETAKAATETLKQAVDAMSIAGATIIEGVRYKSRTAGDGVFPLAQIPAPATPAPVGDPGTPNTFKAAINADGALGIKWKCTNPTGCTGTVYQIWRKCDGGEMLYLGGTGAKEFTDDTIPTGTSSIVYQIQGVRSSSAGPWAQFNVNFGLGTTTVTEIAPAKLAA
jgi:hypothetical protein